MVVGMIFPAVAFSMKNQFLSQKMGAAGRRTQKSAGLRPLLAFSAPRRVRGLLCE
jgi:hypothetical protein